jgi:ribosome biogenesis GTPase A
VTIQWFPGHMAKARRQIEEKLKQIDMVMELLDARIPISSRNPMIDQILKRKPRLVLLNKADLADPDVTEAWVRYFADRKLEALPIDAESGNRVHELVDRSKELMTDLIARQVAKGMRPRAIRSLIVGIPNVGKSTLINRLAGRKIAATGDRPGITKGQQWIKVGTDMELLDTPGILWPKFEDEQVGLKLAATGAIREEILPVEEIAYYTVRYLLRYYPDGLKARYELTELPADPDSQEQVVGLMEDIGRRRGCLQSGGLVNLEKASGVILRDLRAARIGRISLERPDDFAIRDGIRNT